MTGEWGTSEEPLGGRNTGAGGGGGSVGGSDSKKGNRERSGRVGWIDGSVWGDAGWMNEAEGGSRG